MHQILPISGINKFYPEHFIKIPNFLVLLALSNRKAILCCLSSTEDVGLFYDDLSISPMWYC